MSLTLTPLQHIPIIRQGDNLVEIVLTSLEKNNLALSDQDILVFAQKIISKSEGRAVNLVSVTPSRRASELGAQIDKDPRLIELVLRESSTVLRTRPGTIIVEHRLGFVCANAGIDHSNVAGEGDNQEEWVLLLPEDPDASAARLRAALEAASGARLGVLVI